MAFEHSLPVDEPFFAGDDARIEYEVFKAGEKPFLEDGKTPNPQAVPEDVSGWAFEWALRRALRRVDPYRSLGPAVASKSTATGGITVVGVYNADRALNTQRVVVTLADVDTDALTGELHVHGLKRSDDGVERTVGYGTFPVFAKVVV